MTTETAPQLDWDWHGNDYQLKWAETDDPRVLAIIKLDDDRTAPDYDAQAPAIIGYEWGRRADMTTIGGTSNVPDAWLKARMEYDDEDLADRFVRIFYNAATHHLRSSIDQYTWAVVFDAPDWREAMGIEPETVLDAANLAGDLTAYLDGEVFGIGYALSSTRTTTETPVDLDDPDQEWDVVMDCWGFYGESYAEREAASGDYRGDLNLTPLLDHTDPATVNA